VTRNILRAAQVAAVLQVEERTVTRWLRDGYLRGFKLGKEWRIDSADLERFLQKSVNNGPSLVTASSGSAEPQGLNEQKRPH
jgi:excisionase family DNA binding protein